MEAIFPFIVLFLTVVVCSFDLSTPVSGRAQGFKFPLTRVRRTRPETVQGRYNVLNSDVDITDKQDFAYLVDVGVGSQTFAVLFDTGSSDLWVVSSNCTSSDCEGVTKYSQSAKTDISFNVSYIQGSVSGYVSFDTVSLGHYEITSQVIALANQTTGLHLQGTGNSGILGLSFPRTAAISPTLGKTFRENILSNFAEQDRMFAFKLGRDQFHNYTADDAISSFTIGQLDPDITDDASMFTYTAVSLAGTTDYNYWKLPLQAVKINSTSVPLSPSLVPNAATQIAVLDTGTTMIFGPSADVETLWTMAGRDNATRKNPDTGLWEVRCARGVVVGFVLGENGSEKEYVVHPGDVNWAAGGEKGGWCMGGIQANDGVESGDWLLGDVFLRNVYVTHHSETSTEPIKPPLIGLLSMTDAVSAMSEFRQERGPDTSDSGSTLTSGARPSKPTSVAVYTLSTVSGFVCGATLTVVMRISQKSREDAARKRMGVR